MEKLQKIKSWNALKAELNKIIDPKARQEYHDALLLQAIENWGFNPENISQTESVDHKLDDWEQDLLEDIKTFKDYDVDTREEKRKKTDEEFRKAMREYVALGNTYEDIPDDIKCETIRQAYFEEAMAKLKRMGIQIEDLEIYAKRHNLRLNKDVLKEFQC